MSSQERNWAGNVAFIPGCRGATTFGRRVAGNRRDRSERQRRRVRAVGARHSFSAIGSTEGIARRDGRSVLPWSALDTERRDRHRRSGHPVHRPRPDPPRRGARTPQPRLAPPPVGRRRDRAPPRTVRASATEISPVPSCRSTWSTPRATSCGSNAAPTTASAAIVGLGGFGIVARVTLDVEPTYDVEQDVLVDLPVRRRARASRRDPRARPTA